MNRSLVRGVSVLILGLMAGCGSSTSQPAPSQPASSAATEPKRTPLEQEIVTAARQFLEAVIQGDSEQAIARMTPRAIEQMRTSDEAFSPPSWETATFRVGQVRMPAENQAIVQCYFNESTPDGLAQEEMCCLLKLEAGRWGVNGLAFQISPQQAPYILDFEQPPQAGPTQQQMAEFPVTPGADSGQPSGDRYRTAQEPSVTPAR